MGEGRQRGAASLHLGAENSKGGRETEAQYTEAQDSAGGEAPGGTYAPGQPSLLIRSIHTFSASTFTPVM